MRITSDDYNVIIDISDDKRIVLTNNEAADLKDQLQYHFDRQYRENPWFEIYRPNSWVDNVRINITSGYSSGCYTINT